MFGLIRRVGLLLLLPAAILVPYLLSEGNFKNTLGRARALFPSGQESPAVSWDSEDELPPSTPAGTPIAHRTPLAPRHAAIDDLAQVLRFDVNPQWIMQQWPEVSTISSELDLLGMRVVLVTGTKESDLAGALTYYFDKSHRVQRVTFSGTTGDAARLADTVARHFHLKRQPTLASHLYVSRWNGVITSALFVTPAAKIRADQPLARYQVELELNRPSRRYGMSHQLMNRIKAASDVGIW